MVISFRTPVEGRTVPPQPAAAGVDAVALSRPLTVVAIPAGHPYVAGITASARVHALPDPPVAGAAPGVWWPPAALDPAWIEAHAGEADLLHIHFGTESFDVRHLAACLDAARRAGWPVVFTVHDLEHPQLVGQADYRAQLDVLVTGADAVITLTDTAAREIALRWEREATVIRHPSLLRSLPQPAVPVDDAARIGVHLKDLRPNVDGPATVALLLGALDLLRGRGIPATAEVRMQTRVRDETARDAVRALCAARDEVLLIEQERLSDAGLAAALARLDVCVLPYRHGTHSGWLELCWDLGVPVAAPAIGHYGDQHPGDGVEAFTAGDPGALADAVEALLRRGADSRPGTPGRAALVEDRGRARVQTDAAAAAAHADLYARLVAERAS